MLQVHDHTKFHEDGTPKRKYEIAEPNDARIGFRASVGLVVFNTIVLLKNVFYSSDTSANRGQQLPNELERSDPRARPAGWEGPTGSTPDEPANSAVSGQDDELEPIESGFTPKFVGSGPLLINFDVPRGKGPLSSLKTNDNIPSAGGGALLFPLSEPSLPSFAGFGGSAAAPAGAEVAAEPTGNSLPPGSVVEDDNDDPLNRRPYTTGYVSLGTLLMNTAIVFTWTDFLRQVMDPDGDPLRLSALAASSGTLIQDGDGKWRFVPDYGDSSYVTFTYRVSDGQEHVQQTAYLDLVAPRPKVIEGTNGDDVLIGTPEDDTINALAGDDTVVGQEGDDVIFGGDGNDRILAGDGNDVVYGGAGDDFILAGSGDDTVYGEDGDDTIFGEDGRDVLSGGAGNDWLFGGSGDDIIFGGAGNDVIDDGDGNDIVNGGIGDDIFKVSIGDDLIDGGAGKDTYDASAAPGPMTVVLDSRSGSSSDTEQDDDDEEFGDEGDSPGPASAPEDTGIGGPDNFGAPGLVSMPEDDEHDGDGHAPASGPSPEFLIPTSGPGPGSVFTPMGSSPPPATNLNITPTSNPAATNPATAPQAPIGPTTGWASGKGIDTDQLVDIENVITGAFDDDVTGSDADNVIITNDGDDDVEGKGGDDKIDTGKGDDEVDAGDGDDDVDAGDGDDTVAGGKGNDTVNAGDGNDLVDAGSGNDTVDAGKGDDTVAGGKGNDTVNAGEGNDHVDAGSGNDTIDSGDGDDTVLGGKGNDDIDDGDGDDDVDGGSGNDTMRASEGTDDIDGGSGRDTFDASDSATDIIIDLIQRTASSLETGNDTITSIEIVVTGSGNDRVSGDDEDNEISTGAGDDHVSSGSGCDRVDDGDGDDTVDTGRGNDVIIVSLGNDDLCGGDDFDILDASGVSTSIYVNLSSNFAEGVDIGRDTIRRIEGVFGGSGHDTFVADDEQNVFYGGDGNDTFVFRSSSSSREDERDTILDFRAGDRLILENIVDEFESSDSDDFEGYSFRLISSGQEFSQPGELRLRYENFRDAPTVIILDGNTDDEDDIDFQIEFRGEFDKLEKLMADLFPDTN